MGTPFKLGEEIQYNTPMLRIRNRKVGPGWISYLRMGVFYTKFSIITPEFLVFV